MLKKFIYKTLFIIIIPSLVFLATYEVLYRNIPNDFKVKRHHLVNQQDQIETLIFGTSHTYNGVNPYYLSTKAYNLANDGQTPLIDKYLYNHYIDSITNIKNVVLAVSYQTMVLDTTATQYDIWKIRKNQLYLGVKIKPHYEVSYWLECLHPQYYNTIIDYYFKNKIYNSCDSLGFYQARTNVKSDLKSLAQLETHTYQGKKNDINLLTRGNQHIIESIIKDCDSRDIQVYLLTTPCHHYYRENIDTIQYNIMMESITEIQRNYPNTIYLDFFNDSDFIDEDYDNNNHLSIKGAEKLSRKLSTFNL